MIRLNATGFLILLTALFLAACSGGEARYPTGADRASTEDDIYAKPKSIFGNGGISLLGGRKKTDETGASGIGVNSFLWRASLDTISFMPLASADPFGGVILTDWYTPEESDKERFKLNVFILGRQLRSDGVRVRVFRQEKQGGTWKDAAVPEDMGRTLEDTILTRARQLRVSQLGK